MTESSSATDATSLRSRLRERLGSTSPFLLMMLGFIGFLGDAVPILELLQVFHVFWLFSFWPFVALLIGAGRQALGLNADEPGPRDWLEMGDGWRGLLAFAVGIPLSALNPLAFRQDAMQLLGSLVAIGRHRGTLPGPETHSSPVRYRLPVAGTWTVINGSPVREYSHSWFPATQRYAYDFIVTDEDGRSRPEGTDTSVENYYCYDEPVLAPAAGVVVDTHDSDPELGRAGGLSHPLKHSITGNRVTIRHAAGEYSSLVHLLPGSIDVSPGDHVERGEVVGRCGHSGNSSEPHLHFQLQDHPTFETAAGLPVAFDGVDAATPGVDVSKGGGEDASDEASHIHVGQRVTQATHVDSSADDAAGRLEAAAPTLGSVRGLSRVANGLAVGGIVAVPAGFVVPSPSMMVVVLAVLAGLGLAHQVRRGAAGDGHALSRVSGTTGGVGIAAALLGVLGTANAVPAASVAAAGVGLFLTGFLLYVGLWEYGRRRLLRAGNPNAATG